MSVRGVNLRLKDKTLAGIMDSGITLRANFDVKVGTYAIRLVLHEAQGKSMTTRTGSLMIP